MENKGTGKAAGGGMTLGRLAARWGVGLAAAAALVLLCLAPADDAPVLTWQFIATKIGGAALMLAAGRAYERLGGDGDDD